MAIVPPTVRPIPRASIGHAVVAGTVVAAIIAAVRIVRITVTIAVSRHADADTYGNSRRASWCGSRNCCTTSDQCGEGDFSEAFHNWPPLHALGFALPPAEYNARVQFEAPSAA